MSGHGVPSAADLLATAPPLFHEALTSEHKCTVWNAKARTHEWERMRAWAADNADALRKHYHSPDWLTDSHRPTVGCLLLYCGLD
jgi:hypothetical protein